MIEHSLKVGVKKVFNGIQGFQNEAQKAFSSALLKSFFEWKYF